MEQMPAQKEELSTNQTRFQTEREQAIVELKRSASKEETEAITREEALLSDLRLAEDHLAELRKLMRQLPAAGQAKDEELCAENQRVQEKHDRLREEVEKCNWKLEQMGHLLTNISQGVTNIGNGVTTIGNDVTCVKNDEAPAGKLRLFASVSILVAALFYI